MKKIRVLHLIDSLVVGGAQEVLFMLVRYTGSEIEQQVVALWGPNLMQSEFEALGVRVVNLASNRLHLPAIIWNLRRIIIKAKPDIVNLHLEASISLGLIFGPPGPSYAVTIHSLREQSPKWFYPLFSRLVHRTNGVVVEDLIAFEQVATTGFSKNKMSYIPLGTDFPDKLEGRRASAVGVREEFGISPETRVILNVGRMNPGKGQSHLIRAFGQLQGKIPNSALILVGYGPTLEGVQRLADSLGLGKKVFFPGMRRDVEKFYSEADAFVMPALDEAMGVVVYQAMAFGIPIVAFDAGSVREIVENGVTGILTPVGDIDLLTRAMETYLSDSELAQKHGNTGKIRIEKKYSARTMCQSYASFYHRCHERNV